jgi:hypothetical protein
MIGWYCPNKFQCNILLSQFELSPLHSWLNIKFDDMDTKARYIYCHNMKENGVGGEIWRQIRVITKLPNSEQSYKGYEFYWPNIFPY